MNKKNKKLASKILKAANYINNKSRLGVANYIFTTTNFFTEGRKDKIIRILNRINIS